MITDREKHQKKIYRREHKDIIKESNKKYKTENKERLNEVHNCPICGGIYTLNHKSRHFKTKKHLNI